MIKWLSELFNNFSWMNYLVASIVVTLGSFMIHAKQNRVIDLNAFLMWLPIVLLILLILSLGFTLFLNNNE